jgi:hypothetical protein
MGFTFLHLPFLFRNALASLAFELRAKVAPRATGQQGACVNNSEYSYTNHNNRAKGQQGNRVCIQIKIITKGL